MSEATKKEGEAAQEKTVGAQTADILMKLLAERGERDAAAISAAMLCVGAIGCLSAAVMPKSKFLQVAAEAYDKAASLVPEPIRSLLICS